jgi:hypothetical protein
MTTATNWLFNWAIGTFLTLTIFPRIVTNTLQLTLLPTLSITAPERPTSSPRSSSSGSAAVSCASLSSTSSSTRQRVCRLKRSISYTTKSVLLASPSSGSPASLGSTGRVSQDLVARCLAETITRERFLTTRRTSLKSHDVGVCRNYRSWEVCWLLCWTGQIGGQL